MASRSRIRNRDERILISKKRISPCIWTSQNNFLGGACAIFKANGSEVIRPVSKRSGSIYAKSMLAWQKFGNGSTRNQKAEGRSFCGRFTCLWNELRKAAEPILESVAGQVAWCTEKITEIRCFLINNEHEDERTKKEWKMRAKIGAKYPPSARGEKCYWKGTGGCETMALWQRMNAGCIRVDTYQRIVATLIRPLGKPDHLLGKHLLRRLQQGCCKKRRCTCMDSYTCWMDEKLLLRKDGIHLYEHKTWPCKQKFDDFKAEQVAMWSSDKNYIWGLKLICQKIKIPNAKQTSLSYGFECRRRMNQGRHRIRCWWYCNRNGKHRCRHTQEMGKVRFQGAGIEGLYYILGSRTKIFSLRGDPKSGWSLIRKSRLNCTASRAV